MPAYKCIALHYDLGAVAKVRRSLRNEERSLGGGGGGGGEGVSTVFAKQASKKKKKKKELHVDYVRCAPLGPAANRPELRIEQRHTLQKGAATSPSNTLWRKATHGTKKSRQWRSSSEVWMILVTVRRRSELVESKLAVYGFTLSSAPAVLALATAAPDGQKPPVPPPFFPTRWRQACRSASSLLPAVQSGRRHCEIHSMRQQCFPRRRNWVFTRSDCSPGATTCAPPLCSWQRWKKFQLRSWTWNIPGRSMTPSLLEELTRDRRIDIYIDYIYRASDQWHWEGLEEHAPSSGEDFQQWNVEACFANSVRFRGGGGGGWEWN